MPTGLRVSGSNSLVMRSCDGDTRKPVVDRMRPAEIFRKIELIGVPGHRSQSSFFVERHARVVADVHVGVVVPRTPFAGEIDLRV